VTDTSGGVHRPPIGTALAHAAGERVEVTRINSIDSVGTLSLSGWDDSMRSIRMLAAVTSILALATACGGDGGGTPPPENQPPVASFSEVCTQLSCVFTDASADPDEGGTIASRSWNFGEPSSTTNTSTEQNPTHVYAAAGSYTVVLTVTDNEGANSTPFSKAFTVSGPPVVNVPPVAGFTSDCDEAGVCAFTSTSTDIDGTIATYAWNFGDAASGTANTSTAQNPSHTYTVTEETDFTVTLTVTDNAGATNAATGVVTIAPPAAALCGAGVGKTANCDISLTQAATLTFTITSRSCEIGGNQLDVTQPIPVKNVTFNGCFGPPAINEPVTIMGAGGTPLVYQPGTIRLRFTQGTTTAPTGNPQIRLEGTYPDWTLHIDDGGTPSQPADFDDIVVTVHATRQ
jgi:PKD repeat protein